MSVEQKLFGFNKDGEKVRKYIIRNQNGMEAVFTDYGAILISLLVKDNKDVMKDVVLGYEQLEDYFDNSSCLGSFIGRNTNRIADAKFKLNDKVYRLEMNERRNNLHSGNKSYNKFMYNVETMEEESSTSIAFSRTSVDGEQGFPGNLEVTIKYTITEDNEIIIEYFAESDKDTIVNLSQHSYFNLDGHDSGVAVSTNKARIYSDYYTPLDRNMIPTGEIVSVENTPFDFREAKRISLNMNMENEQIAIGGGFDHNYVLNTEDGEIKLVAELSNYDESRKMLVYTDMPGLQFYTGNFLECDGLGKNGVSYGKESGICLETQFFPNACNEKNFKSSVLKAFEKYNYTTVYKFI